MPDTYRAKVRMYRHGLGDCFLIRIPVEGRETPYTIMIDCGVILGTSDPVATMSAVVDDIAAETGGKIDLLAITHEHWDHVSGFAQVADWSRFKVGQVWFGWTEDPRDELARRLDKAKDAAVAMLMRASGHMRLAGADAGQVDSLLSFFGIGSPDSGVAGGGLGVSATRDARERAKRLGPVTYHLPGEAPHLLGPADGPRIFVLGPPHDEAKIKRFAPSKAHPETYDLAAAAAELPLAGGIGDTDPDRPFGLGQTIPIDHARGIDFFRRGYWGQSDARTEVQQNTANDAGGKDGLLGEMLRDQSWRRIDGTWHGAANELALKLDSATNNTSLVLAIELEPGGDVLLFAGDAQVGNWLSWHDVKWDQRGGEIGGADILRRTILYKAGHHGSHNATLKELGLELMVHPDLVALVPVDHAMAVEKHWDQIPRPSLMRRLHERAKGRVLRSDDELPLAKMFDPAVISQADWDDFQNRVGLGNPQPDGRPLWYEVAI